MRTALSSLPAPTRKLRGHFRRVGEVDDKNVVCPFALVARALWPDKTSEHIAAIGDVDVRTAQRWLKGTIPPDGVVIVAIIVKMLSHYYGQRWGARLLGLLGGRVLDLAQSPSIQSE